jgi:hypothetical protein
MKKTYLDRIFECFLTIAALFGIVILILTTYMAFKMAISL